MPYAFLASGGVHRLSEPPAPRDPVVPTAVQKVIANASQGRFARVAFAIKLTRHMTQLKLTGSSFTKSQQLLLIWLLACTLLIAQTLGLMHGEVHGLKSASGIRASTSLRALTQIAQAPKADRAVQADQATQATQLSKLNANSINTSSWVNALFSSHHGDNECRLYDQSSHGSAMAQLAALALPVVLPPVAVAIFKCEALARWVALFDARGPPLTS